MNFIELLILFILSFSLKSYKMPMSSQMPKTSLAPELMKIPALMETKSVKSDVNQTKKRTENDMPLNQKQFIIFLYFFASIFKRVIHTYAGLMIVVEVYRQNSQTAFKFWIIHYVIFRNLIRIETNSFFDLLKELI